LVDLLGDIYDVSVALDGESALESVEEEVPSLILLDIMMPGIDGYEVCKRLKSSDTTKDIPVIFLTAMTEEQDEEKGLNLGAVDYIHKPFSPSLVLSRVKNHLELKMHQEHLEELVRERTQELQMTQDVTIASLATLAEYRDPETGGHINRTKNYVKILAKHLRTHDKYRDYLSESMIDLMHKSTPLHDIGKVGVPDSILLKPGKLTDDEFNEMKKHTIYGRDALKRAEQTLGENSFLQVAREIAESHHEKWNGSGYPHGLAKEGIHICGCIMAIADVYDALVSKRCYKDPIPHERVVEIIKEGRGQHFDPDIVDAFLEIAEDFREISIQFADYE